MPLTDYITPQWLKDRYLLIDLTDDNKVPFKDEMYEHCIEGAIAVVSTELDIELDWREVASERHDVSDHIYSSFFYTQLKVRPTRSVTGMDVKFGAYPKNDLPAGWAVLSSPNHGQLQIMPGPEGIGSVIYSGGVPFLGISGMMGRAYTPHWLGVSYEAGFTDQRVSMPLGVASVTNFVAQGPVTVTPRKAPTAGGSFTATVNGINKATGVLDSEVLTWSATERRAQSTVKEFTTADIDFAEAVTSVDPTFNVTSKWPVPADIIDCIAMTAAMLPLDIAGDLIIGAGIASKSISIDGLSTSVGTTSSAENSGYSARIKSFQKRYKETIKAIKRRWRTPRMAIF